MFSRLVFVLALLSASQSIAQGSVRELSGSGTVFASAARTATANSTTQTNSLARGVVLWMDVTVFDRTTGDEVMDCKVQVGDPVSGVFTDLASAAWAQVASATPATTALTVYPGIAETANVSVSDVLPGRWRVRCVLAGNTPSATFSIGYDYIP